MTKLTDSPPARASHSNLALQERNSAGGKSACEMLQVFASVGAIAFDVTFTDLDQKRRGFRANQSLAQALNSMPYLVESNRIRQINVIVRPRSPDTTLVQLDDLDAEKLARVAQFAFLVLETSPGNRQAWIALSGLASGSERDFRIRLRKGTGADPSASGAVRVAGTLNFKPKYAPDFPLVQIAASVPGHFTTAAELAAAGLLAPPAPPPPSPTFRTAARKTDKWPRYDWCLERAPIGSSGHPQRTRVDFTWCKMAISWGHGIEETAAMLRQLSGKARENGAAYALTTAQNAAQAAAEWGR